MHQTYFFIGLKTPQKPLSQLAISRLRHHAVTTSSVYLVVCIEDGGGKNLFRICIMIYDVIICLCRIYYGVQDVHNIILCVRINADSHDGAIHGNSRVPEVYPLFGFPSSHDAASNRYKRAYYIIVRCCSAAF